MFKDRSEELRRLEEALLAEEEDTLQELLADDTQQEDDLLPDELLDELLDDTSPVQESVAYQNFSNGYGKAYNTDQTDVDLEDYSSQLQTSGRKDRSGLVILLCLIALGILGVLIVMMLRYGGFL